MQFTSRVFLLFLPIVFLLYWFVFRTRKQQNLLVVVASYVFYGWWDWRFLSLLFLTSASSFLGGLLVSRSGKSRWFRKTVTFAVVAFNLLILAAFKYYDFFAQSLMSLLASFGFAADWPLLNVILPMGISFYTFQALSYTVDIYRGTTAPSRDAVEFLAYISFFPQLVAGPIERATSLLPQFRRERKFDYATAVDGTRQMLWGFFKKLVVADRCAWIVNDYWNGYEGLSAISLVVLGTLFSFQIYCDFSGYSDIAIGCAKLFGIRLMKNFDLPYFSRSIPEFWRRWHISLMSWMRDYVYIPLGGKRGSRLKTSRNVLVVWLLSGLWHGANWTFVCWGLYHCALIVCSNLLGINTKKGGVVAVGRCLPSLRDVLQMAATFLLVMLGWIVFRCSDINEAAGYFTSMAQHFLGGGSNLPVKAYAILALCAVFVVVEWLNRTKEHALQLAAKGIFKHQAARWTLYLLVILLIMCFTGESQTFIYFQF